MAITRRQFIKRTSLAAGATAFGPGLFPSPLVRRAMAETIGERYLIVLFLDGGNDGFNTVVPYDDGVGNPAGLRLREQYERARKATGGGGIRLSPASLARPLVKPPMKDPHTQCELGLHPGLAALRDMYDQGMVAVVQGCGYPDYNLSHDESRIIWQTANPQRRTTLSGTGWTGRHLEHDAPNYQPEDIPAVAIDYSVAPEFRQTKTSVLAIGDGVENFNFPFDDNYLEETEKDAKKAVFNQLHGTAAGLGGPLAVIGATGGSTLAASELFPASAEQYLGRSDPGYGDLDRSTGYGFQDIAKIIYGGERNLLGPKPPRFFHLSNGGYDTHSNQGGATGDQFDLHFEVAEALRIFFTDLQTLGNGNTDIRNKVLVMIWSEFSRRIEQNDNGTDHGSQGPMLIVGGAAVINEGVYGNHPDVQDALDNTDDGNTVYSQNGGNGFRSTDFRDVYGTILKHWVNMAHADIVNDVLPLDTAGSPDDWWHSESFDLGFL